MTVTQINTNNDKCTYHVCAVGECYHLVWVLYITRVYLYDGDSSVRVVDRLYHCLLSKVSRLGLGVVIEVW